MKQFKIEDRGETDKHRDRETDIFPRLRFFNVNMTDTKQ